MTDNEAKASAAARVLLVDDERDVLSALARMFASEGIETVPVSSVKEALSLCADRNFDVVISDIGMPLMDGITLGTKIREICPEATLFAFTGSAVGNPVLNKIFDKVFMKPADMLDLISETAGILGSP